MYIDKIKISLLKDEISNMFAEKFTEIGARNLCKYFEGWCFNGYVLQKDSKKHRRYTVME